MNDIQTQATDFSIQLQKLCDNWSHIFNRAQICRLLMENSIGCALSMAKPNEVDDTFKALEHLFTAILSMQYEEYKNIEENGRRK